MFRSDYAVRIPSAISIVWMAVLGTTPTLPYPLSPSPPPMHALTLREPRSFSTCWRAPTLAVCPPQEPQWRSSGASCPSQTSKWGELLLHRALWDGGQRCAAFLPAPIRALKHPLMEAAAAAEQLAQDD